MPTISDVARRAGVSVGTVSNVINNVGNVTPTTREKVERAIKALGYVPSASAQSLRSKRTRWLTMVVPTIAHPHWQALARGVEDAAHSRGYAVFLGNTDESPSKQEQYIDIAISHNVAGVIIAPCNPDADDLARLWQRNIPTVLLNRRVRGRETDGVFCDNISGARALVRHLIALGHQRIAMVSGPKRLSTMQERVSGYCIALAEAGLPVDPALIKFQRRHMSTSEYLTYELLDQETPPTAIFVATDDISKGVIKALGKRGLRIPHDVALVTFGDQTRAVFPFLTHILEPGYEMGMNAAQLLFSRLDNGFDLAPRQVVLPTRLIVRYSCGSKLKEQGDASPFLPVTHETAQDILVKPLNGQERAVFAHLIAQVSNEWMGGGSRWHHSDGSGPEVGRLLRALQHQEPGSVPHLEMQVRSKALLQHVLGRQVDSDPAECAYGGQPFAPEDQVEFAQRMGLDAIVCSFSWQLGMRGPMATDGESDDALVKSWNDLDNLSLPPSLAEQLSRFERYRLAVQSSDVGVAVSFTSFFSGVLKAVGQANALPLLQSNRSLMETLMDLVLEHQETVARSVCDRFSDDLALVIIDDHIARCGGLMLPAELFQEIYVHRMRRLVAPAREHGKPVVLYSEGKISEALPILADIGFDAVGPLTTGVNDIFALHKQWAGRMAFVGGFPLDMVAFGSRDEIEAAVRSHCAALVPGGGYVFGCSAPITESIPPENFVLMTRAVRKYGVVQEAASNTS